MWLAPFTVIYLKSFLVLLCISYPFFFQTLLAILFSLELLNYLVSYTSLCSVLVFLKGRGVRYDTSWLAVEIAFFPFFFLFLSLDRDPGKSADVGLGGRA